MTGEEIYKQIIPRCVINGIGAHRHMLQTIFIKQLNIKRESAKMDPPKNCGQIPAIILI